MDQDVQRGYKVLTHHFCSPIQGGEPLWDGTRLPYALPHVTLDTGSKACGAGWNYCATIEEALHIAGFWPDGRPVTVFEVEGGADALQREEKRRSSQLTLVRQCSLEEIRQAIERFSAVFEPHANTMMAEQYAWFQALSRPLFDSDDVERSLQCALTARALPWTLKQFPTARDARDAWVAWVAWVAWGAREARGAWGAWGAWDAWATWAAWAAWDAWDALMVTFARLQQWIEGDPLQYTIGIRDAYQSGLEIVIPLSGDILGWAMQEKVA